MQKEDNDSFNHSPFFTINKKNTENLASMNITR